jgi:ankyrin repeat protein
MHADGLTTLHKATDQGHTAVVRLLLDTGAAVNAAAAADGRTALHYAASGGRTALVQLLLDAKAETSMTAAVDRRTALYLASPAGHTAAVQLLLAVPQLAADVIVGAAGAAAAAGRAELAILVFKALMSQDMPTALQAFGMVV